ncbi:MAG: hypothetical protein ACI9T7_001331 [Oleiphilaceae bacterium]|jgi:hypothetical protein
MNKVKEYIAAKEHDFLFKADVSQDEIIAAQDTLGFKFDSDYDNYLAQYGLLSYESMETMGLGVDQTSYRNVVTATLEAVKQWEQFPSNAVILEDIGEGNYVIYIMHKGAYQFSPSAIEVISSSLEEYLLLRFSEVSN